MEILRKFLVFQKCFTKIVRKFKKISQTKTQLWIKLIQFCWKFEKAIEKQFSKFIKLGKIFWKLETHYVNSKNSETY